MKKLYRTKKTHVLWLLVAALTFSCLTSQIPFTARAQETTNQATNEMEESAISLAEVSNVTIDTEGSVTRIYGSEDTTYNVPINITASCTVILDHVCNAADLTVADGTHVKIRLRGTNVLQDICANGGIATQVRICGESEEGSLTADDIACSIGGSEASGAEVIIDHCTVTCQNLGCGEDGEKTEYLIENRTIPSASPGGNASPCVTIQSAAVTVNGSIACGGDGILNIGSSTSFASDGGTSGEVIIDSSYVTVSGNAAIGGQGGNGVVKVQTYRCLSGNNSSSSPVTIRNHSTVIVDGKVSTQRHLPNVSYHGTQTGLHGVTVTVSDSVLRAKDIASGGNGHVYVHYDDSGDIDDIYGTAGGDGGTLIADHADIICDTAVCGGNAGRYTDYPVDENEEKSDGCRPVCHPSDGSGGVIRSVDSILKITKYACERGSQWSDDPYPAVHRDSVFYGGTLSGTVYGSTITTDMTSVLSGAGFKADVGIKNSNGLNCAGCVLQTAAVLSGQAVQVKANDLTGNVTLDDTGSLHTYLGIGDQVVSILGSVAYAGAFTVTDSEQLNVFQLKPGEVIQTDQSDGAGTEEAPDAGTDPGTDSGTDPGTDSGTDPGTDGGINPGTGNGSNPGTDSGANPGTGSGTNTDHGTAPGTGTAPDASYGGSSQPSAPSADGNGQTSSDTATHDTAASDTVTPDTAAPDTAAPDIVSPSIAIQTSLKGISMLSANAKNTYKLYTKKKISLKITREADTDYYYKVLRKGQQNSEGKWKKLNTDRITVSNSAQSAKGQRIVLKAVNEAGSTIIKTTGFVIDAQKPAVTGVKNARFYQKKCEVSVSDNCGSCEVRLNGKKVKQSFTIQKKGIYLLTASDPAGNQRTVLFAIL